MSALRKPRFWIGAGLIALVLIVAWVALPYHPTYQEWRSRGRSLAELQDLQTRSPESPIVLFYLGDALHRAGRDSDAVPPLERAARLDQHSVRIRETLAQAQLATGQTRAAFDLLRRFLESHPDTPEAYHLMGRFLLGVQTYSRAIVVLEEATRRFPGDGTAWTLLASARQQFRDLGGAQDAVSRAVTLRPSDPEAWLLNARILKDRGVPSQARAAYEKAVQLAPNDVELKAESADFIARGAGSMHDLIFASAVARRVLQQQPGHPRATMALGIALAERNQVIEARPLLMQALEQNPRDVRVLTALARVARRERNAADTTRYTQLLRQAQAYRDSEKQLQDALTVRPKDTALLERMAQLTGRGGEPSKSLRYHAIALNLPPDAPQPLLAVARDLRAGGYEDAARQFAERALAASGTASERAAAQRFLATQKP